jgi:hypothetical protein
MAGLLAAGAASVTLAQPEPEALAAGSPHFFLLVPVTPPAAPGTTNPDGSPVAPGEDESSGDATPGTGGTHERSFILIPIPQDDASIPQDDDDDTDGSADGSHGATPGDEEASPGGGGDAMPGTDEDTTQGPTLILVPRQLPRSLPEGILET